VIKLETRRLIIEELEPDDAPFTLALLNDEAFIQNIGDRGIRTVEQARQYLLEGAIASYLKNGFGMFAVRLRETGETLGMCGLVKRPGLDNVDIGYGFLPAARGQGYALEATRRVLSWATQDLKIKRLVAIVSTGNMPSRSLLEKIGMQFESMIRLPGDEQEICLYTWNAAE
jgi:ribosomal-protein-alanine N-acetyltransferase